MEIICKYVYAQVRFSIIHFSFIKKTKTAEWMPSLTQSTITRHSSSRYSVSSNIQMAPKIRTQRGPGQNLKKSLLSLSIAKNYISRVRLQSRRMKFHAFDCKNATSARQTPLLQFSKWQ